jgi:hypothetical protein
MKGKTLTYLGMVTLGSGFTCFSYATIALSTTMDLAAFADANTADAAGTGGHLSLSPIEVVKDYSGSVTVWNYSPVPGASDAMVKARAEAHSTWVSANQGTVTLVDTGWTIATPYGFSVKTNSAYIPEDAWTYTFQAEQDGWFIMDYDVGGTGYLFGLNGVRLHWTGIGSGLDLVNAFDPTASGSFMRELTAGDTYTIGIASNGNLLGGRGDYEAALNGRFDWRITDKSVPGPAALIPFVGGLLLALRRKLKK